jgi:hypothetical protein
MSTTNHGTQTITFNFYQDATSVNFNKINKDIVQCGIYNGFYLTRVSDVEVTLAPGTVAIGDNDVQVRISTADYATLNASTLDSGDISPSTPYIVLRWVYVGSVTEYMEIHAIASVAAAQSNDIIVGKCVFSGSVLSSFDYTDRTFLDDQHRFLLVQATGTDGMYVRLQPGKVQTGSAYVFVPRQTVGPFTVPSSPNSRVDLVYVNDSGAAAILAGTPAVSPSAPDYGNKLVLAEVTIVNGDTNIAASRVRDVRAFLTPRVVPDGSITTTKMDMYDSGWFEILASHGYTKPHGLGAVPKLVMGYIGDAADGSGVVVPFHSGVRSSSYNFGTYFVSVDATNIKVMARQRVAEVDKYDGTLWAPTSGYAKIIAIL